MKENYYLYLLQDETAPTFQIDGDQIATSLIQKYETPEVKGEWGNTTISSNRESKRTLWAHHITIEPQDLGRLVSDLASLRSVSLTITKTKYDVRQQDHLGNTPVKVLFRED